MEIGAALGPFQGRLDLLSRPQGAQLQATTDCGGGSTHEECVPRRLGTSGRGKCLQPKAVSHPRRRLGGPRSLAAPWAPPLQAWPQGCGQKRPVPSGSGSRRLPNRFSSQPGAASLGPGRPDPRSGIRIKDRLWTRAGSRSKAPGLRRLLLSFGGGRQAAPAASPAVAVDYNGSLLCLGHFKEKFSSMNTQPASLAHG